MTGRVYVGYELCHPLPLVGGQPAGLDCVDESARLAAEYLRGLLRSVGTS